MKHCPPSHKVKVSKELFNIIEDMHVSQNVLYSLGNALLLHSS